MQAVKIVQIVPALEIGGLERVVINLAEKINSKNYNVVICCLEGKGDLRAEAERKGIRVISADKRPGKDFLLPLRLASILKNENARIVHTHNSGPLLYGTLAAKIAQIPVVINTKHGRERRVKNNLICRLNDRIVTISEDAKKELLKVVKLRIDKVEVIYNGIDERSYSKGKNTISEIKKGLKIAHSDLVVGTIGRLSPEKDHFTLLLAFSELSRASDNVKLIVVGDGLLRRDLEAKCSELGIKDKVKFLGFRDDIAEMLSIFDVFVLSSVTEGISLTLLEAMAAGKTVVATNVGGNPEVVEDGVTGFLVPPQNPEKLAETINNLLKNRGLSQKMGEAGRNHIKENFTLERMVKEYETLYERLLNEKNLTYH